VLAEAMQSHDRLAEGEIWIAGLEQRRVVHRFDAGRDDDGRRPRRFKLLGVLRIGPSSALADAIVAEPSPTTSAPISLASSSTVIAPLHHSSRGIIDHFGANVSPAVNTSSESLLSEIRAAGDSGRTIGE
jgi:hypothetical protein